MPELHSVSVNGIELNVAVAGSGPAVLLLHGFPHTWEVWMDVMADLSDRYQVIAPDLRGFGASGRAATGYDAESLADDAAALLTALGVSSAAVVGIDAGTPPAFLLALRRPDRVRRLVVMESLLGRLPGAEDFLTAGPPWWFGFHAVPDLAETVLEGREADYVDWFLRAGTLGDGVRPPLRDAFTRAYTGRQALRCAFSYYRALPQSAAQIEQAVAAARLTVPTMAVGAHPVGAALERQLRPIADDLTGHLVEDCGHIIPLHRPQALLALLRPFLEAGRGGPTATTS
ncbi:alpha/beta hydrolase [Streptomyces misionensis]|uniref:Alpha/beta hydrolase n=1 Tax=Streptomyces misionensis TaxID=67331 RepID=A0A5C6J0A2_9ACTN|nr:alpha/beta hydrolase [Streptomyces misionensis]TWV30577.1 alpha/beta hydrolase [Streptomyces misionensis]TWV34908.1 alpha/beta hydrolase [Streptomyces misionensis]TWV49626.1 alpha/beta hydrolase [Streptomyces misionensis]